MVIVVPARKHIHQVIMISKRIKVVKALIGWPVQCVHHSAVLLKRWPWFNGVAPWGKGEEYYYSKGEVNLFYQE